ncbi:DUF1415 domain-containing protein [Neptunicella sp. SCSIO 80796]|uniref:DUF1415 domain-containing protein n=1 Tax=Neptunicella plasticusilytica TaxID=3117012 RepID=UPI003A4DA105
MNEKQVIRSIEEWLDTIVIGLNLCPFAAKPRRQDRIRIIVSDAQTEEEILTSLDQEILHLSDTPTISTSLLVLDKGLCDFEQYNQFLQLADDLLVQQGWQGIFQIASFHPGYQFAGTDLEDKENLTNRSPYPILHILREEEIEDVLRHYPDPDNIPRNNIARMTALSATQIKKLFPYLSNTSKM